MADFPIGQGKPLGYVQIGVSSTAVPLTTSVGVRTAVIAISGQAVRFRDDGTAPTSGAGFPVATGVAFTYVGAATNLQVIAQTGTATVDVLLYGI